MNEGSSWPGSVPPAFVLATRPFLLSPPVGPRCDDSKGAARGLLFPLHNKHVPLSLVSLSLLIAVSHHYCVRPQGLGSFPFTPMVEGLSRHTRLPTSVPFPCRGLKESCNPKTVHEPLHTI